MNEQRFDDTPGTVLVAYATRYGSTQETAEKIAETLRDHGTEVDVRPAKDVSNVAGYRAVVLGGPFYIGSWHKDARQFLTRHQDALVGIPLAIFALGPIGDNEQQIKEAREQLDQEMANHPWLEPIAIEMFGGKYDPERLSFGHKLLAIFPVSPLHNLQATDSRDWAAIRGWADDVANELMAELVHQEA